MVTNLGSALQPESPKLERSVQQLEFRRSGACHKVDQARSQSLVARTCCASEAGVVQPAPLIFLIGSTCIVRFEMLTALRAFGREKTGFGGNPKNKLEIENFGRNLKIPAGK
jgi:hypothetical protein